MPPSPSPEDASGSREVTESGFEGADDSHTLYRTERYLFCATCGFFARARQLRKSGLIAVCKGKPQSNDARKRRDRLMVGKEPSYPACDTGKPAWPVRG